MSKQTDLVNISQIGPLSNRNMIINGGMQVSQRGTSFAGVTNGSSAYTLDRWAFSEAGAPTAAFTITQDADGPDGFAPSLKWDCTTAQASLGAADAFYLEYKVEAQDLQRVGYGSASALTTTMSFRIKSNKTGTYTLWLFQADDSRHVQVQYTIDAADTWETKTCVIPADATGVIDNDNGTGFFIRWVLGSGTDYTSGTAPAVWASELNANRYVGQTVNLADNTANYLAITGVQLELGDTATPFEHRSYGDELAACQRYYQRVTAAGTRPMLSNVTGIVSSLLTSVYRIGFYFPVTMRATPTFTGSDLQMWDGDAVVGSVAVSSSYITPQRFDADWTAASGLTAYRPAQIYSGSVNAYASFDAEL